jgi:hypothetical protein
MLPPADPGLESRAEAAGDAGTARRHAKGLELAPPLLISAATGGLLAYLLACLLSARPGHDQSWYLYSAGRMLAGVPIDGPHLVDTNPPFIIWFSAVPSLFARWSHGSPSAALTAVVSSLICLSALWSVRVLRSAELLATPALLCFAFAAIAVVEGSTSAGDFGQREQLLVIFLSPYLLYAVYGGRPCIGLGERVALGIAAGVAVCFKPQHLLSLVCFELALLLLTRRPRRLLRIELLALAVTPCIYLLLVRLTAPLYLTGVVPVLRDTYWAFGTHTIPSLLHDNHLLDGLSLLALAAWTALRRRLRYPAAPAGLLAAGCGAALVFCIQRTGWHYQFFPWKVFFLLSLLCMALDLLSSPAVPVLRRPLLLASAGVLCAAAVLPACLNARLPVARALAEGDPYLKPTLGPLTPNTPVYIFATTIEGFDFVLQNRLIWAGRYAHLWMLPAIVRDETGHLDRAVHPRPLATLRLHQLEDLQRSSAAEDLHFFRPAVVLIERCDSTYRCPALEDTPVDILAWFRQSPAFAAEWASYRRQPGNDRYDIYTRIP